MPAEHKLSLNDSIGGGKGLVHLSRLVDALEGKIVAQQGMNDGRRRIQRHAHVCDGFQFLVVDQNCFGGILRQRTACCHDGSDGLALPTDPIDRDGMLRRRFQTLQMRQYADPGRDHVRKFRTGYSRNDARHFPC